MKITSRQNPRVKALARLKTKRGRKDAGRFLVEGTREIARALEGAEPVALWLVPEALKPEEAALIEAHPDLPRFEVTPEVMEKIAYREHPGGLILEARPRPRERDALMGKDLYLVAVGLEKPGNLGAIFRSADSTGAGVIVADAGLDPYNPNVIRASTGTVFTVPFLELSREDTLAFLKERGAQRVAASPHAEATYWDLDYRPPTAFLIGPEATGLSPAWLEAADARVQIPMAGRADSLNASVTAALLLYEARRQRRT